MITFRKLDEDIQTNPGTSALEVWYEAMRDVPLEDFGIGDLCRAGRQELFLEQIVPLLIDRMAVCPRGGELYDDEIVSVVARIPSAFWKQAPQLMERAKRIFEGMLPEIDADVAEEARGFLAQNSG